MTALFPGAKWRPVPSHSGLMTAHLGLILHVQVGDNSCFGEFDILANQASSTWWSAILGGGEQYVDADYAAWTEAAGNFMYDSVETEGVPSDPLTQAQIEWIAQLYVWGHGKYGWPLQLAEKPGDRGLGWHGMGGNAWGGHPDCPGVVRKAQRPAILSLAQNIINETTGAAMARFPNAVQAILVPGTTNQVWVVGSDGGVGAFNGAPFHESMGGQKLNKPVSAIVAHGAGGYWLIGRDGGIFAFGDAPVIAPYQPLFGQEAAGDRDVVGANWDGVNTLTLIGDDGATYALHH